VIRLPPVFALAAVAAASDIAAQAQPKQATSLESLTYADLADLALGSPAAAEVRIKTAAKVPAGQAATAPPGRQRLVMTADVTAAIRAPGGLPPRISYLYDAPRDARGKIAKLEKTRALVFGFAVAGRPGFFQLGAPDAQVAATPQASAAVRAILSEALAQGAPPQVTGVGRAFHVAGTLEGDGESQIFMTTTNGRPISFNVVRASGLEPRWSVSIDEIVDENAPAPKRDTLLWYRLACFLPARLPAESVEGQSDVEARILAEDYATVIAGLGRCERRRAQPPR
jgi:hypothetical protein